MLVRTAYATMAALLESIAEGTVFTLDPARADTIALRGDFVDNPHEE
jgi:hypothetical protein